MDRNMLLLWLIRNGFLRYPQESNNREQDSNSNNDDKDKNEQEGEPKLNISNKTIDMDISFYNFNEVNVENVGVNLVEIDGEYFIDYVDLEDDVRLNKLDYLEIDEKFILNKTLSLNIFSTFCQ